MNHAKWTVRRSSHVCRDRWITLREDECVTPEGVVVAPYYVVEYPDWVHVVALDDHDRLLLVRQYRHGTAEFTLELPAGRIDRADADALAAGAVRRDADAVPGRLAAAGARRHRPDGDGQPAALNRATGRAAA